MKSLHKCALVAAIVAGVVGIAISADAGALGGPRVAHNVVTPGETHSYQFAFVAGEPARIRVEGDGDGDIDCVLLDERGNIMDTDTRAVDGCFVTVTPRWTGVFTLRLRNEGPITSAYGLFTN